MSKRPVSRPEVLAPAGDSACMRAAVEAGADAVYFGVQAFNARARATNFDAGALGATMRELHSAGVKGYVTLNTLVFDDELAAVEALARACAEAGADAVIVQDLGVARLVGAVAPGLPIHASTQMTCTDAASVQLARSVGARRVILARELSLDDIAAIRAVTDVQLEVFVHGALCIAYSGQCLTSEAIGGRSANRGECAQACRLPYQLVVDGALRELGDRAYLLSPQDLEASALVPRLCEIGVASLKIEGRLKGPAYVAATTRLYRRAVDAAIGEGAAPTEAERRAALQTFSRGSGPGFLQGVDHQRLVEGRACDHRGVLVGTAVGLRERRGRDHLLVRVDAPLALGDGVLVEGAFAGAGEVGGRVWTLAVRGDDVRRADAGDEALVWLGPDKDVTLAVSGRRVWKTSDPASEREVMASLSRAPHRTRVDVCVRGTCGERPVFEAVSARGHCATVHGDAPVETARSAPTTAAVLREKLGKLGDTGWTLGELTVDLPADAMLPMSSVNRARRALVEQLQSAATPAYALAPVSSAARLALAALPEREAPPAGLFVLCRTLEQAVAALDAGADGVYLDFLELTGTGSAVRALRKRGAAHVGVAPPRIRKPGEEKIDPYLATLAPDSVLVRGLGALQEDPSGQALRIGDASLNVTNRLAAAEVLAHGLAAFTPAFDLDPAQLEALCDAELAPFAEVVVYHPVPLFHMEHCVYAALLTTGADHRTCGRPCDEHALSLRDRTGAEHPVVADVGCRNTVFRATPESAAHLVPAVVQKGVRRFRIELVRERADEVARVVSVYRGLLSGQPSRA